MRCQYLVTQDLSLKFAQSEICGHYVAYFVIKSSLFSLFFYLRFYYIINQNHPPFGVDVLVQNLIWSLQSLRSSFWIHKVMGIFSKHYCKVLLLNFVSLTVADKILSYLVKYKQKWEIFLGICPVNCLIRYLPGQFANNPIE